MKLCVLVPSEEYKANAGTRIRYERMRAALSALGIGLSMEPIGSFEPGRGDCDVLLVSKCHDARALMIGAALADRGVRIGVDLFDDYFSDPADSRLIGYRGWLSQLTNICDFALCSTDAMAEVVAGFHGGLPVHVMNDPAAAFDSEFLSAQLSSKLEAAISKSIIRVGWYGVGDNPYFPVGLDDLASYGSMLSDISRSNMDVRLTVLTNKRALSSRGLGLIQQLPIATDVREWSEAGEQELLRSSLLVFLPVNFQPFSRAKSLNRAVTALSAGCQILSAGYPLYGSLAPFIYRDAEKLLADIGRRSLRFSAESVGDFCEAIDDVASPRSEAGNLAAFLSGLGEQHTQPSEQIRLIHGHTTRSEAHRLVKALGGLSVASPYTGAQLEFDVVFRGAPSGLEMLISRHAANCLRPSAKARLGRGERCRGFVYLPLVGGRSRSDRGIPPPEWNQRSEAFQLATYGDTMRQIERDLDEAFGCGRNFLFEHSQLPFFATHGRA